MPAARHWLISRGGQSAENSMRWLIVLLLVLLVLLQGALWLGDGGIPRVRQLSNAVSELEQENQQLQARNEALQAEVNDLREGLEAVEERARSEQGLIKEGETFYQVVSPKSDPPDAKD